MGRCRTEITISEVKVKNLNINNKEVRVGG